MTAMWVLLVWVGGFVAGLVVVVIGDLVSEEVRDRLDGLPHELLRLASRRLPAELREDRLAEWSSELYEFLRGAQARPVTRLVRGVRYAAGLLQVASRIGRTVATTTQTARRPRTTNALGAVRSARRRLTRRLARYASDDRVIAVIGGVIGIVVNVIGGGVISIVVVIGSVVIGVVIRAIRRSRTIRRGDSGK